MRILVLGSRGMLGYMVFRVLSQEKEWEVTGVNSNDFDAVEYTEIGSLSQRRSDLTASDYIINCIGITADAIDERDPASVDGAMAVNARFPHALAQHAETIGARVIHMSTNGVFSGKGLDSDNPHLLLLAKGEREGVLLGYKENDLPNATDSYGRSKIEGEVTAPHVLNIRCSIIGPSPMKKKGLFEWFRAQPDGATIHGYTNHFWNGVITLQFAELCRRIIIGDHFESLRREGPAIHFVPNTTVTKYELLVLFQKLLQKKITIVPTEDPRGARSQLLACTSKVLPSLFPHAIPMERAIADLAPYAGTGY